jgi:hypothetical protein
MFYHLGGEKTTGSLLVTCTCATRDHTPQKVLMGETQVEQRVIRPGVFSTRNPGLIHDLSMGYAQG